MTRRGAAHLGDARAGLSRILSSKQAAGLQED
jgi:hypothetical protein